jgi:hypothetical protein
MRSSIVTIVVSAGLLASSSAWADAPLSSAPAPAAPGAAPAPAPAPADAPAPPAAAEPDDERTANNAVYLEGLGPGLFYSINYDRSFGDFAGRIGFGYVSIGATSTSSDGSGGQTQETASASFFTVPITASYLGLGNKKHMLELGAGVTIVHVGAGGTAFDASSSSSSHESATFLFPVGVVGYRYQPPHGGFLFRGGISPIIGGSSLPILPWPYLALGGTF